MAIQRSNFYGSLTAEKLAATEQIAGVTLPAEYRSFLLKHNGGVPDPNCFVVPGDEEYDGEASERSIACFFAIHDRTWDDNTPESSLGFPLQESWVNFQAEVPKSQVIPVGKDWNGSYVCIGVSGEEEGQVFFYDHDYEALRLLAVTFSAFLDALYFSAD